MVAFVVMSFAILAVFVSMARLATALPWSTYRLASASMLVLIVGASIQQPVTAVLFALPVLAARRLARPFTHVPDWFSHPAGQDFVHD